MKNLIVFFYLFSISCLLKAQTDNSVKAILDGAYSAMTKEGGVELTVMHDFSDSAGELQYSEEGTLRLQDDMYFFSTSKMMIWCNSNTRWNYMVENGEIYISEVDPDFVQALIPSTLFRLYDYGFKCVLSKNEPDFSLITMTTDDTQFGFVKVQLRINKKSSIPERMRIYYTDGHYSNIRLKTFTNKFSFDKKEFECNTLLYDAEVIDMR